MVVGAVVGGVREKFLVDPENDFQVARQHVLHQRDRPGFQRLGHQGVVGVGEGLAAQGPGVGPAHAVLVAEHAHQLRDRDRGVGVVEVNRHLVRQVGQRRVFLQMAAQQILDRGGDKEVLLLEPQLATGRRAVVRVQDPRDVLVFVLGAGRARVVAGVEGAEVKVGRRHRLPQPQRADSVGAVAGNHHVIGLGGDLAGVPPQRLAVRVFDPAAKVHGVGDLGAGKLPGCAILQPGIGVLGLTAVLDVLREHAIFIADAVAKRRQAQGRHGVEKAGRQTAQATVAQGGIGLLLGHVFQCLRMVCEAFRVLLAQVQGRQRVGERAAHQELHR